MKTRGVPAIICILFITNLLCPLISVSAQAPRRSKTVAANKKPAGPKCSGAWTGVMTFTRTHRQSDSKRVERVSARGVDTSSWEIKGDYTAQIVVTEDPSREGSSIGHATINHSYIFTEKSEAVEKNSCDRGKTWRDMRGTFTDKTEFTGNGDGIANVSVGVGSDGQYSVGVGLPQIPGKVTGSKSAAYGGQCTTKEGKNETFPETERSVDGHSLTSDGRDRVDPENADRLSGSYSLDYPGGVVETITWNLRRCGGPIMITDVKLYHPLYPSPNSWIEVKDHTNDGNMVKIVATLANLSGQSKITHINFKELKENVYLPDGKMIQVNLAPNEEREVEYVWDTSGYAWKAANVWNQPEINRQIEVKIPDDVKTADIQVQPKPVIVVPGLFSKPELVHSFIDAFKSIPSTEWTARLARVSIYKTAAENAPVIDETVRAVQKDQNAWHVDLVAHSTGGLMARSYVHSQMPTMFDGRPVATHLVMVGTPNMGTPCSTGVETIFTRIFSRNAPSFNEVSIKNMRAFNDRVKSRNGTKFSILVGNGYDPNCQMDGPGDGITPNRSAIWTIKEWKFSTVRTRHEDMLGQQANFTQIVNWLAIGPKGDHNPGRPEPLGSIPDYLPGKLTADNPFSQRNYGASYHPAAFDDGPMIEQMAGGDDGEPDFATGVKLAAGRSVEVPIAVTKGSRLSVTFLAPPNVSATLTDAAGTVVATIRAGTPEAEGFFRTITVKRPFENGTWKLTLENAEQTEAEIAIIAFIDFNSNIFAEVR